MDFYVSKIEDLNIKFKKEISRIKETEGRNSIEVSKANRKYDKFKEMYPEVQQKLKTLIYGNNSNEHLRKKAVMYI